jgi:plastocyanin
MKSSKWLISVTLLMGLILAACSSATSATQNPPTSPTVAAVSGTNAEVVIKGFAFAPNSITVKAGTTVTWTNEDSVTHTVTSDTGLFDSGGLNKGGTFSYTFTTEGSYPYHCTPHASSMAGTVIVTK